MVVGKAVSGGFAVVEQNELRSTIEIKDGKLVVNGKVIDISAPLKALSGKIAEQKTKAEAEPEPEQQKP
jgi:formylmethanofuran dehydrogenase subunit C